MTEAREIVAREIVEAWRAGHRGSYVWQDTLSRLQELIAELCNAIAVARAALAAREERPQ